MTHRSTRMLAALLLAGATTAAQAFDFVFQNRLSPAPGGFLGRTLALNDGFVFAGAPEDADFRGRVYLFRVDASGLTLLETLRASAESPRRFGQALASAGEWAAIGNGGGSSSQAIDLYRRSGESWRYALTLRAPEREQLGGLAIDDFGRQLAMDGDRLIVGDASADDPGVEANVGIALIYGRNVGGPNAWGFEDFVISPNADPSGFGDGVAIDGATALVAEAGVEEVHVYTASRGSWRFLKTLEPEQSEENDGFGDCTNSNSGCLAIDGDLVAVGANAGNETIGSTSGAVHVFSRDAGGADAFGQIVQVVPSAATNIDVFGQAVAIAGDLLFVSAPGNASNRVYVYRRDGNGFVEAQVVLPPMDTPFGNIEFGSTVAYDAGQLVLGAERWDDNPDRFGAVFSYRSQVLAVCGSVDAIFCDGFEG